MAREDWLERLLTRMKVSLRLPQGTSLSRLVGFNEAEVIDFFLISKVVFTIGKLYNMKKKLFSHCTKNKTNKHHLFRST